MYQLKRPVRSRLTALDAAVRSARDVRVGWQKPYPFQLRLVAYVDGRETTLLACHSVERFSARAAVLEYLRGIKGSERTVSMMPTCPLVGMVA